MGGGRRGPTVNGIALSCGSTVMHFAIESLEKAANRGNVL